MQAGNNNNFPLAIELFERVAKEDPKHKGLWNNLGRAYLLTVSTRKLPTPSRSRSRSIPTMNTHTCFWAPHTKACSAMTKPLRSIRRPIEVSPLDASAHIGLGSLYSKLKRWNEAVPELEKAASLQDKNPLIQIALGQAYIATGQTDKGMAAFDKAIALSPTAVVWNNIAYSLAEQNVQLDRANQYSDAAINALETQLRDVNLDSLRQQDIFTANLLYAVWDTKGWVEYKRGNLDIAERYIRAAWNARPSGEVGLHLAEIAEKRGKKDEALTYYTDALAVESPSVEARSKLAELGVTGDLAPRIESAIAELKAQRTRTLAATGKGTGDFFVLASPAVNEQVRFVSGDAEIRGLAATVKAADLGMLFPDSSSVRALRRGTVSCGTVPAPQASKGKNSANKAAKVSSVGPPDAKATPAGKAELVTGPCTVELIPSGAVRSIE